MRETAVRLRPALLLACCLLAAAPLGAGQRDLAGTVVVLDPGHGGTAPGMVGPNGTREADFNLAVARALAADLSKLGATVVMTRTADADLLARPAPLKDELRARAMLADSVGADLFVSLHHNATPDRLNPVELLHRNRSEVYLKLDDEASPELGARLLAGLARLTRSPRNQLFPSNFSVLRNNTRPAVLGEPFYLSIDLWERYAARPGFAALEATCYASAIEGFLGGPPRPSVRLHAPFPGEVLTARDLTVRGETARAAPGAEGGALRFTLDGQPSSPRVDWYPGGGFTATFPDISQGAHDLTVAAVDALSRVSPSERRSVEVSAPPADLQLSTHGPGGPGPRLLEVRVLDRHGRPVRDGTQVTLVSSPASTLRTTSGGAVMFLLEPGLLGELRVTAGACSAVLAPQAERGGPGWYWGHARDARTGAPLPALDLTGEERSRYSAADGVYVRVRPDAARSLGFSSPGYVPGTFPCPAPREPLDVALVPVLDGALRGLKVSLDASARMTEVCPALCVALSACGAVPEVRPEPAVSDRVRASNARHDDLYLLLAPATGAERVTFYAASPRGRALSLAVSRALGLPAPVEGGDYVLSNTGGTTVALALAPGGDPAKLAARLLSGLARGVVAFRANEGREIARGKPNLEAGASSPSPLALASLGLARGLAALGAGAPPAGQAAAAKRVVPSGEPARRNLAHGILLTADGRLETEGSAREPGAPGELKR